VINTPGARVLERTRTYVNVLNLNHATLRRAPRGRPDLAGCLPRCIRTDGRVKLCAKNVPTLVEPHTFVHWVLKEEHSHQTFGQWRRHQSDGQSILPALDRARPCGCYATTAHVTAAAVPGCLLAPSTDRTPPARTLPPVVSNMRFTNTLLGFLIDSARDGPRSRRGVLSTIMEPLKIDPVPLGASQIPTHKPPRRCVAVV
jgi:hypothetical protein